jgi:exodeoxyribonuclease V alpha subunit
VCALARVSVLAGGPGTGKTTTVARLLGLLREQHPEERIALAAPTGKAAARLEEAVRSSTAFLPAEDRDRLGELSATTLHRLLGWRPEARTRFRHDRGNRLPYEVVVVDESSMVSLTMMARLLEALRPTTRLVLVGDPDQLASVEAGAVLGDVVQSVEPGARTPGRAAALAALGGPRRRARWRTTTAPGCATAWRSCWSTGASTRTAASPGCPGRAGRGRRRCAGGLQDPDLTDVELVPLDDDAVPGEAQLAALRADVWRLR